MMDFTVAELGSVSELTLGIGRPGIETKNQPGGFNSGYQI